MSYSTSPVVDASRHYEPIYEAQDQQDRAEQAMEADFLRACRKGDANALADWAPSVVDYKGAPYAVGGKKVRPMRVQTLAEVLRDAMDYSDGPAIEEALQLVLNAANGTDVQALATGLLERMARKFAQMNVDAAA